MCGSDERSKDPDRDWPTILVFPLHFFLLSFSFWRWIIIVETDGNPPRPGGLASLPAPWIRAQRGAWLHGMYFYTTDKSSVKYQHLANQSNLIDRAGVKKKSSKSAFFAKYRWSTSRPTNCLLSSNRPPQNFLLLLCYARYIWIILVRKWTRRLRLQKLLHRPLLRQIDERLDSGLLL